MPAEFEIWKVNMPEAKGHELYFSFDSPRAGTVSKNQIIRMTGWAYCNTSKINNIAVYNDTSILKRIRVGGLRPDVGRYLAGLLKTEVLSEYNYPGFRAIIEIPERSKELKVIVELENDVKFECAVLSLGETNKPPTEDDPIAESQFGEIEVLKGLIQPDWPKYVVDVGAHDGHTLSNSYSFVKEGFKGLLCEPMPHIYEQLCETHMFNKNATCKNLAVSNFTGTSDFFVGNDGDFGMNSTLCSEKNPWLSRLRSDKTIKVKVDTLTNLLKEADFPKDFSFLSIDTEGNDYEVLLGLDFNKFKPRLILTEEYHANLDKHNQKYMHLLNSGYILKSLLGLNSLWMCKEHFPKWT